MSCSIVGQTRWASRILRKEDVKHQLDYPKVQTLALEIEAMEMIRAVEAQDFVLRL